MTYVLLSKTAHIKYMVFKSTKVVLLSCMHYKTKFSVFVWEPMYFFAERAFCSMYSVPQVDR